MIEKLCSVIENLQHQCQGNNSNVPGPHPNQRKRSMYRPLVSTVDARDTTNAIAHRRFSLHLITQHLVQHAHHECRGHQLHASIVESLGIYMASECYSAPTVPTIPKRQVTCFKCQKTGHYQSDCPLNQQSQQQPRRAMKRPRQPDNESPR
jgi:hypothetical protein